MSDPTRGAEPNAEIDVLKAASGWLDRDGRIALATVISTWGSAPVPVGGQMAIAADGRFQGSISGGCIEGEVIAEAEEVLGGAAPRKLSFGVADEAAWRVGLPCGGEVKVYLERIEGAKGKDVVARALAAREARRGLVIRTDLADGSKQLFERSTPGLPADIAERFRTAKSELVAGPSGEVFVQALVPPARILVIGATHIAQILTEMAQMSGYEVIVVDPRTAFASADRFRSVKLYAEWPQDAIPRIGLDPYTAVAVVAHVSHIDDEALKLAVKSESLYIGALGSNRNHTKRKERLTAAGITPAELARIKNPIGIDIGAQTPAEIAVSILAEIIRAVRGPKRKGGSATGA